MSELPIACTLTADELRAGAADLLPGLIAAARDVTALTDGVRLNFAPDDGAIARIAAVIERERRCCAFLRFTLVVPPGGGAVSLEVTGPEGTRELLGELVPALLERGSRPPASLR